MLTDIGEYFVGAYLKLIEGCDFVDYNVRPPGGGLKGLGELDVIGIRFNDQTAYLCEVTTHISGLVIVNNEKTITKIRQKHERQREYVKDQFGQFKNVIYQFWSPVVPVGYLTENLPKIRGLDLVINGEYKRKVAQLRDLARREKYDARNPVFRTLQILEHLRD